MLRDHAADDRMAGTPSLAAYLPRILLYPLQGFCLPVVIMIALFTAIGAQSLFGIPMLTITAIWAIHYLLQIVEHTAQGHATAPPLTGEAVFLGMQTVLQALLLPALGLFVAARLPAGASAAVLALTAFLFPAALFALAISRDWNAAANPLRWLGVIAGMGTAYLLPCALLAAGVLALRLTPPGLGLALMAGLVSYLMFATAHLLGFVGYHRRERLGFEARVGDPGERRALEEQSARLEQLLAQVELALVDGQVEAAARAILREPGGPASVRGFFEDLFERLQRRRHPVLLHTAGRRLIGVLLAEKRAPRALEVYETCENLHPGFETEDAAQRVALAQQALEAGHHRLVDRLLADFAQRHPGDPALLPAGLVLARSFSARGDDARALAALEPLLSLATHPQHAQARVLAGALRKLNRPPSGTA